jgi:signal transduction histidine kinase
MPGRWSVESLSGLAGVKLNGAKLKSRTAIKDGDVITVKGIEITFHTAVRNLLENAKKHGGEDISVSLEPSEGGVLLVVQDRGPGVPEDLRERIFDPFFRPPNHSEGRDGGVGLGLALVRRIVKHHQGTVRCVERNGGGARFEVQLSGSLSA